MGLAPVSDAGLNPDKFDVCEILEDVTEEEIDLLEDVDDVTTVDVVVESHFCLITGLFSSIKLDAVPDADVDATPDVDDTTADKDDATADFTDDDATSDVDDADVEEATPDVDVEGGDETGVCGTGVTILCLATTALYCCISMTAASNKT